jgi:hypothetical protein
MMKKVTRGERILERLKLTTGLSEDGLRWLIETLDPMHDEKLHVVGYPDRTVAPSVTQMVKKSATISKPSTFSGTDPWGFHLMVDDQAVATGCQEYTTFSSSNYVKMDDTVAPVILFPTGGLNVVAFENNTAVPTWKIDTTEATPHVLTNVVSLDPGYLLGKTRILASGVEVVNTTAELYRGGSVLCYEAPESKSEQSTFVVDYRRTEASESDILKYGIDNIFVEEPQFEDIIEEHHEIRPRTIRDEMSVKIVEENPKVKRKLIPKRYYILDKGKKVYLPEATVVYTGVRSYTYKNVPPNTLTDAMLLPGTQQWGAEEGIYMVQTMSDMDNPPSFVDTRGSLYSQNELSCPSQTSALNASRQILTDPPFQFHTSAGRGGGTNICEFQTLKTIPFHRKGAIFTGLTPQSTFTVNYFNIIERVVSQQDTDLVVLAIPSPGEDQMATKLYTEIVKSMPVACRFKDNGLGDWFLGIADGVANFVSSIGKPIMGAVEGYQKAREAKVEVPTQGYGAPKLMTPEREAKRVQKKVGAGRVKKSGAVAQGPVLPSGKFRSAQAKAIKNEKKGKQKAR